MERTYEIEVIGSSGQAFLLPLQTKARIIPNGIWVENCGTLKVWKPEIATDR
jgi:hypothetical protein